MVWLLEHILYSPFMIGSELDDRVSKPSTIKTVAIHSVTIPLTILMAPFTVPAAIGYFAKGTFRPTKPLSSLRR